MKNSFNDTDVLVLVTMIKMSKNKEDVRGKSMSRGVTIDMLEESVGKSKSRIRMSLKLLLENELITYGIKIGSKHSYVLLPNAIEWLKSINNSIIDVNINE